MKWIILCKKGEFEKIFQKTKKKTVLNILTINLKKLDSPLK